MSAYQPPETPDPRPIPANPREARTDPEPEAVMTHRSRTTATRGPLGAEQNPNGSDVTLTHDSPSDGRTSLRVAPTHTDGTCTCGVARNRPAEYDAPGARELTPEEMARHDVTGWDTTGCDCGHDGMGPAWHATDCEWRAGYEYGRALNAPLPPRAVEYIRQRLADDTTPRHEVRRTTDGGVP